MDIFQVDDAGRLFISPAIDDWDVVASRDIDVVIDLDGGLDLCIPTTANRYLYVYFPFEDDDQQLPDLTKLRAIARLAGSLITFSRSPSRCTSSAPASIAGIRSSSP